MTPRVQRRHTFRRTLLIATLTPVGFVAAFGGAVYAAEALKPAVQQSHPAAVEEPREVRLVEDNHCWSDTGEHPDAHSVVATLPGEDEAGLYGQAITDRAIEQWFFGIDHGLVVHGFCAGVVESARG